MSTAFDSRVFELCAGKLHRMNTSTALELIRESAPAGVEREAVDHAFSTESVERLGLFRVRLRSVQNEPEIPALVLRFVRPHVGPRRPERTVLAYVYHVDDRAPARVFFRQVVKGMEPKNRISPPADAPQRRHTLAARTPAASRATR